MSLPPFLQPSEDPFPKGAKILLHPSQINEGAENKLLSGALHLVAGQETSNSICAKVGLSQNSITQTSSLEIKLEFREMTRELLDTWGCGR
ncbi:hypothetical protein NPIL_233701 [Nephila pilipes]|uniref:Uncharacterized protein n=1 Tax=Nephila pilipes TaxID=299642 RepID=A0A8X6U5V4_NEPPI|nr:hypothetical protein NPIL_233701 [Nephila pilipes]